jgi:hypothetical protein
MTEQYNIVLQCDVGPSSTTTAATTTEAAATSAAEATSSTGKGRTAAAAPGEAGSTSAPWAHARHACLATGRLRSSSPARRHVHGRTATTAAAAIGGLRAITATLGPGLGAISASGFGTIATTFGTIRRARPIAATIPDTIATAVSCPIADAIGTAG